MTDNQNSPGDEGSSRRLTKGATKLRQLLIRRASGEKIPMDIGFNTDVASNPYADVFNSYLGVLARDITPS